MSDLLTRVIRAYKRCTAPLRRHVTWPYPSTTEDGTLVKARLKCLDCGEALRTVEPLADDIAEPSNIWFWVGFSLEPVNFRERFAPKGCRGYDDEA